MQLKLTKRLNKKPVPANVSEILNAPGKFLTEAQLAEVLGLNIQKAVIEAAKFNFSRIPVKKTYYYSKKQVRAFLDK